MLDLLNALFNRPDRFISDRCIGAAEKLSQIVVLAILLRDLRVGTEKAEEVFCILLNNAWALDSYEVNES